MNVIWQGGQGYRSKGNVMKVQDTKIPLFSLPSGNEVKDQDDRGSRSKDMGQSPGQMQ